MAKPRVFLSSTFYDLRYVRSDLERFIQELGYEPVLSEKGQIPYGKDEPLEKYCYREISTCDILVHIIGGRYGSSSTEEPYSISQVELKTAHELNKQIYVFIEKPVHVEYKTYLRNEKNDSFQAQYVDDARIYKFIKEIYALGINNIIADFDTVSAIIQYLKEQWAGLFQRFLQELSRSEDYKISSNLKQTSEILYQAIGFALSVRDESLKKIYLQGHPLFQQLSKTFNLKFQVYFGSVEEMIAFFTTFGYTQNTEINNQYYVFEKILGKEKVFVSIRKGIFGNKGELKEIKDSDWDKDFIKIERQPYEDDNDLPF